MEKPKLVTVIVCGLAAAICTVRAILGVVYQEYSDSVFWFVLNVLNAVIWITVFIKWLIIYRSNTKE